MARSNETVDRLNQAAQQRRIRAGEIGAGEWLEYPNGLRLHVGDEIATRRNDRTIETDRHEMVRNRDLWTVTAINDDWTFTGRGAKDVTLPTANPRDHVELAYAIKGIRARVALISRRVT